MATAFTAWFTALAPIARSSTCWQSFNAPVMAPATLLGFELDATLNCSVLNIIDSFLINFGIKKSPDKLGFDLFEK